jgi:hypothetical protein
MLATCEGHTISLSKLSLKCAGWRGGQHAVTACHVDEVQQVAAAAQVFDGPLAKAQRIVLTTCHSRVGYITKHERVQ